jgi:hypothetical protein
MVGDPGKGNSHHAYSDIPLVILASWKPSEVIFVTPAANLAQGWSTTPTTNFNLPLQPNAKEDQSSSLATCRP